MLLHFALLQTYVRTTQILSLPLAQSSSVEIKVKYSASLRWSSLQWYSCELQRTKELFIKWVFSVFNWHVFLCLMKLKNDQFFAREYTCHWLAPYYILIIDQLSQLNVLHLITDLIAWVKYRMKLFLRFKENLSQTRFDSQTFYHMPLFQLGAATAVKCQSFIKHFFTCSCTHNGGPLAFVHV